MIKTQNPKKVHQWRFFVLQMAMSMFRNTFLTCLCFVVDLVFSPSQAKADMV